MPRRERGPIYAAGIIERVDNDLLIALPPSEPDAARLWVFPRGRARDDESPEAAMRRIAQEQLGLTVEVVVGQPPVREAIDGATVEIRYFFCGIIEGVPATGAYAELRWISRAHLREYEFDAASRKVVDWLIENRS